MTKEDYEIELALISGILRRPLLETKNEKQHGYMVAFFGGNRGNQFLVATGDMNRADDGFLIPVEEKRGELRNGWSVLVRDANTYGLRGDARPRYSWPPLPFGEFLAKLRSPEWRLAQELEPLADGEES